MDQFCLPLFRNLGNFIHLKLPVFCLVSMPGEVKDSTQGVNVLIQGKDNSETNDNNGQQVDQWSLMEEAKTLLTSKYC